MKIGSKMMTQVKRVGVIAAASAILFGCNTNRSLTSIAQEARPRVEQAAPVVVFLPGTLAARLENARTQKPVWGLHSNLSVDPRTPEGLRQLSLPITPVPSNFSSAPDDVRASGLLRRAGRTFMGLRVSVPIYEDAMKAFVEAGLSETDPGDIPVSGPSVTPFPYDWRRSIVDGAQRLGAALEARGEGADKVTIVAHSMGGTVALHYLMYGTVDLDPDAPLPPITWEGAKHVERAILVAPPLRGAAVALRNTINGNRLVGPLIPTYPTTMLATHPSSFELMPRPEEGALRDRSGTSVGAAQFDRALWEHEGWGLANPLEATQRSWLNGADGSERDTFALDRQATLMRRAIAYHTLADRPIDPPEGLDLLLIAGTGDKTPAAVNIIDGHNVEVVEHADGDGTVTRASATAGFEDSQTHPRKTLKLLKTGHARMVSNSDAFDLILQSVAPK